MSKLQNLNPKVNNSSKGKRHVWTNYDTIEKVQNFINTHPEIQRPRDLEKVWPGLKRIIQKNGWSKEVKYPTRKHSWEEYNTIDDINKFIKENNILSTGDFKRRFDGLYCRVQHLGLSYEDLIYEDDSIRENIKAAEKRIKEATDSLDTISKINQYIKDNKITSKSKLRKDYRPLYTSISRRNLFNELKYYEAPKLTFEEIDEYVKLNKIHNPKELRELNINYYKFCRNKSILSKLSYEPKEKKAPKINRWDYIKTSDDVDQFVKDNDIQNPKELVKLYPGLYDKISREGWTSKIIYPNKTKSWANYNTIEEIQLLINSLNIKTKRELIDNWSGLADKISKLGIWRQLNFSSLKDSGFNSYWEIDLYNKLKSSLLGIESIDYNVRIEGCKDKRELIFDIVIRMNNKNIIVEVNGPTHFIQLHGIENYILCRKHDIMKYRWAKSNNYYLFYFTYEPKLISYGYPYYIYTSEKELMDDIIKTSNKTK